ncbi:Ca(2+)/H(+) antiporter, partial [Lachnellula suecica]
GLTGHIPCILYIYNRGLHTIKREARKEAWYGDFPFRRTIARPSTWGNAQPSSSIQHAQPLSYNATEPSRRLSGDSGPDLIRRPSTRDDFEAPNLSRTRKLVDPESSATVVEVAPTGPRSRPIFGLLRRIFGIKEAIDPSLDEENYEKKKPWIKPRKHGQFTFRNQIGATIMGSWVRLLLLLTPIGFVTHYLKLGPTADFLVNFFAILPLTDMFGQALVEVKTWAGDPRLELVAYVLCGNINQTFTSAILLHSHQIAVLKSTLLGGMLLRILLITSIAILTNDARHRFQRKSVAVSLSKHLSIALTGLIIPTALSMVTVPSNTGNVAKQSRGVSIVLLCLYGIYLYSEWRVYSLLGLLDSKDEKKVGKGYISVAGGHVPFALSLAGIISAAPGRPTMNLRAPEPVEGEGEYIFNSKAREEAEADIEDKEPQLHFWVSIALLLLMGALLALHILFISDSLHGFAEHTGTSMEFIGLILLPILGLDSTLLHLDNRYDNETVAQTTLGLGLQTILFMIPVVTLVGWAAGIEGVDLLFSSFEVTVLFPAVLVVQASIEENEKGWLKGATLFSTYLTIAIAAWYQK